MMLGTFPKAVSQATILPKGIFPSGIFPNVQFPQRQLSKSVLAVALSPKHVLAAAIGPPSPS